jgi:hypothetical protein
VLEQGDPRRRRDCSTAAAGIFPPNRNIRSSSHNMVDSICEKGATTFVAAAAAAEKEDNKIGIEEEEDKKEEDVLVVVEAASWNDEQNTKLKKENEKLRVELERSNTALAAICVVQAEMQSTMDALSAELESKNQAYNELHAHSVEAGARVDALREIFLLYQASIHEVTGN